MTDPITALRDLPTPLSEKSLEAARLRTHVRIDELASGERAGLAGGGERAGLDGRRKGRARIGLAGRGPVRSGRAPVLAFAATAAAAAAIVLTTGGTPATTEPPAATAATVLRDLAERAGAQSEPQLGPGEYYAVRVVQRDVKEKPPEGLDLRYWADARGEGREVAILHGKTRRDVPLGTPDPRLPKAIKLPELREFPTDPKAVAERMRGLAGVTLPGEGRTEPTTRDYVLAASQMVTAQRNTPPDVLRAVFEFLSGLPGMKLVGDVVDPLGRPGKAVAADGDPYTHEGVGVELIVDPENGRPLAFIHYRDGDVSKPWLETTREEGVVRGTTALP